MTSLSTYSPKTVHIKALGASLRFWKMLEQNYRYDVLAPDTLLDKYVGKTVKVYRYNEEDGYGGKLHEAKIMSFNDNKSRAQDQRRGDV